LSRANGRTKDVTSNISHSPDPGSGRTGRASSSLSLPPHLEFGGLYRIVFLAMIVGGVVGLKALH
jgi:hypothetical protein